ncbi:hypothetical protein AZL_019030 [Azospirillum sp. B510]|nr:hypothetical protein AZL_019030 [Azospirillum sp. B510]
MAGSKVTLAELEVRMSGLSAIERYNALMQGAGSATEIAAKQFEALDRQQQAVAASATRTTARLRETDREWKSLERSIPGTTAAMERFARVSGQADAALAAGRITVEQHAAAVAKLNRTRKKARVWRPCLCGGSKFGPFAPALVEISGCTPGLERPRPPFGRTPGVIMPPPVALAGGSGCRRRRSG